MRANVWQGWDCFLSVSFLKCFFVFFPGTFRHFAVFQGRLSLGLTHLTAAKRCASLPRWRAWNSRVLWIFKSSVFPRKVPGTSVRARRLGNLTPCRHGRYSGDFGGTGKRNWSGLRVGRESSRGVGAGMPFVLAFSSPIIAGSGLDAWRLSFLRKAR